MDAVLSLVGHAVKQFAFEFVLFWPGWLALKILTLGKYPRLARPSKDIEDYSDFQAISYFGLFVVLLSSALFFKFFPA
ncbi:MAG: hypothetical protein E2578_12645 [Comamonas sp.]|uniref:Uncharacterized protein n=1 Tax=Comamonas testosteroni TaxID=285 RepID=A0A096HNQ8_COMTE|nr:hypothetical protein P353_09800 [Comamonas testosteroni]MPT10885.1 hypothetical protein [Comamonas sp.]